MTVNRSWAPIAADRFYNLVMHHFYDNTVFYLVDPKYIAAFGYNPYPPVAEAWQTATTESDPVTQSNERGYVSFHKCGPTPCGTLIRINLVDQPWMNGLGYAPFAVLGAD